MSTSINDTSHIGTLQVYAIQLDLWLPNEADTHTDKPPAAPISLVVHSHNCSTAVTDSPDNTTPLQTGQNTLTYYS